jgi:hypothetical protein
MQRKDVTSKTSRVMTPSISTFFRLVLVFLHWAFKRIVKMERRACVWECVSACICEERERVCVDVCEWESERVRDSWMSTIELDRRKKMKKRRGLAIWLKGKRRRRSCCRSKKNGTKGWNRSARILATSNTFRSQSWLSEKSPSVKGSRYHSIILSLGGVAEQSNAPGKVIKSSPYSTPVQSQIPETWKQWDGNT